MKFLKKSIFTLLIILAITFLLFSLYLQLFARASLEKVLERKLNREVYIGGLIYYFPLGLQANNVNLEGILRAKKVNLQFSLRSFLKIPSYFVKSKEVREIFIKQLFFSDPHFKIDRSKYLAFMKKINDPEVESQQKLEENNKLVIKSKNNLIHIKKLLIKNGFLEVSENVFLDKKEDTILNADLSFNLNRFHFIADNFTYPLTSVLTKFIFSASIDNKNKYFPENLVKGGGWINLLEKEMEAGFVIKDKNKDDNLILEVISENNEMEVKGTVMLKNLGFIKKDDTSNMSSNTNIFLDAASSIDFDIETDFSFKTKMDDFRIGNVNFSGQLEAR